MPATRCTCLAVLLMFPPVMLLPARSLARTIGVPSEQPTIQAGLNIANPGDTVLVAAGVYSGDGNRNLSFDGRDLVLASESGPQATILDGSGPPPYYHAMVFHHGETRASVVDGFTFRGFYGTMPGALDVERASPTIAHCIFTSNVAGYYEGSWSSGGAAMFGDSSALVRDCRFEDNSAGEVGGAVAVGASLSSDLTFERCTFAGNEVLNGKSNYGGAVACGWGGPYTFRDCVFDGNRAAALGGALYVEASGAAEVPSSVVLERCSFLRNEAGEGGAIGIGSTGSATLVARDCSFWRNVAAPWGGGAICAVGGASIRLDHVTMAGNGGDPGSGIQLQAWKSAPDASLDNVIVAWGGDGAAVSCDAGSTISSVSCCDVFGNAGGDWVGCLQPFGETGGNFSTDPLFCDLDSGDLNLDAGSPCLPGQHPHGSDCALIGAFGQGCGEPTAVEPSTWGLLKAGFGASP